MEHELRRTMRRVEPPPDFTERLMGRIAATPVTPRRPGGSARWLAGLGVAASLAAAATIGWMQSARRAEAEQARHDVELALRITTEKLQHVQSKVHSTVASMRDRF